MNALDLLLQRVGSGGGSVFDRLRGSGGGLAGPDPDWQASPAEVLDLLLRVPGQGGFREQLHPNALSIYGRESRPQPPGDIVLRPGQTSDFDPTTPLIDKSAGVRSLNQQIQPNYFPGPGGGTRIAMRAPPGAPRQDTTGLDPIVQDMLRGNLGTPLPPGLPLGVQDQIRNQPSYGEGMVIPGAPNPLMEQEAATGVFAGPQREDPLAQALNDIRNMNRTEQAIPEGWGLTSRPAGQSPFASPLNQLMQQGRRLPFSLY